MRTKPADKFGMNIKSFLGITSSVTGVHGNQKVDRAIKSDSTHDRDANGQQLYQENKKKKEKMSTEQFDRAVTLLKDKNFVKEMNWSVVVITEEDIKYACVQASDGSLIRRISEFDLWDIFENQKPDETKGQLIKRTA